MTGRASGTLGLLPAGILGTICAVSVVSCDGPPASLGGSGQGAVPEPVITWDPPQYVVYWTDVPPPIDGRLTDPSWQNAPWTAEFVDIEGPSRSSPRLSTRAKMLWDSTYLYIGATMEEPHVWGTLTERDAVIYLDNDFEVFIDPDGDTHNYYELEVNALGTEWDLFLVKPYRDGGPAINAWDIQGLQSAVFVDGTLNDPSDTDRERSVEIAIPWSVLGQAAGVASPPEPESVWRANFSRVQWRSVIEGNRYEKVMEPVPGRSRPEDNWVWAPQGIINMHYPEMWGFVRFSELEGGGGHEVGVPIHEAAKWTLRRVYYRERAWYAQHGVYTESLVDLNLQDMLIPDSSALTISATPTLFEASLTLDSGRTLRITRDGRVW